MSSAKKASLVSYASVIFYVVAGFLYTPYLVKTLGTSNYGLYALAASLVGYFSLDFGIGAAQTRLCAKFIAEGRPEKIRDLLGITARIYLAIDIFILCLMCLVFFYVDAIFSNLSVAELEKFKVIFIITACFVLINFPLLPTKGLFQAFDRVYELTLIDLFCKMSNILAIVGALYFGLSLYGVVLANILSNLIAQLFRLYYVFSKERLVICIDAKDREITKFITSFSLWATVAMVADKFFFGVIPFLLAAFSNTTEVAIFAIVISIEGYTLGISRSLSGIFLPRVMKMVVNEQTRDEKTTLMVRVGRIQLYIIGLIISGLIGLGYEFIQHWLGPGYEKSYYCLVLVITPCVFHLTQTIAEELLLATNKVKYRALSYILGSSISVICIVLLSPKYGAFGPAIGVCLSFLLAHNLLLDIFYHKKIGVNILTFFTRCHLRILPVLVVCAGIGYLFQEYIETPTFFLFLTKGLVWATLSALILWLFAFNKEEKLLVYQILHLK